MDYVFHWEVVSQYGSWIVTGVEYTALVAVVSMALAMAWGLVVALGRMSRAWIVRSAASLYISVFRAIPLLVFILWAYYGVTLVTGLDIDAFAAGVLCLTLQYAGWLAEIYRSGIQAVDRGQTEAALATGMTRFQTFRKVVWPQAWRIIIPPTGNMFVGMLKDSSLVSVIGVGELMRQTEVAVSLSFRPFELYSAAALIYIGLTLAISRGVSALETHYRRDVQRPRRWTPWRTAPVRNVA
jgi:His/Glu/Gln/Arg/opine family amino acid ABC transporter permease subunit